MQKPGSAAFVMLVLALLPVGVGASGHLLGAASPRFSVATVDSSVGVDDLHSRPVLVLFADTSERSQKALSRIAELYDYYAHSELAIITVVVGVSAQEALALQEEHWLTYTLHSDGDNRAAASLGVRRFPTAVVLDGSHVVRYVGPLEGDNRPLESILRSWMRQKVFFVVARQFHYTPELIRVNKGDSVLIKMISEDVEHGMYVDGYERFVTRFLDREGNAVPPEEAEHYIKPGELGLLSFTADKPGKFALRCATTCGEFHPYMIGLLRVDPNGQFLAFVAITSLMAIGSAFLVFRKQGPAPDKLFGLIPLSARFELTRLPGVRALLKSRFFPLVPILVNLAFFTAILFAAWVGGFRGAGNHNLGVMIVWILWWVMLMLFMVPFVGRLWCMVCPFPLIGDWIQRGKLFLVGRRKGRGLNLRWPAKWRNLWPLVILFWVCTWFSAFFTVRPMATFILLGTIIAIATLTALIFEKRTFCLFICPVSGFQGLYANFSMCEIRVKDKTVCARHTPKTCISGNEKGYGCPWMELPFDMNRNTYCGMCLECFKTCPHDNMALNLRPFGTDMVTERRRTDDMYRRRGTDEAFKALTMVGIFLAFFLAFQGNIASLKDMARATTAEGYLQYLAELTITDFLAVPGVFLLFSLFSKLASRDPSARLRTIFVNFSYCLVPIGLAIWGAFSVGIILPNGSYVVQVLSDPFAWGWNLLGTARFPWTPVLTRLTPYAQAAITLAGYAFALDYGFKLSRQTFSSLEQARNGWLPMLACLTIFTSGFLWLFAG